MIFSMIRARPTWIVGSKNAWTGSSPTDPHAICRLFDFEITDDGSGNYLLVCMSVDRDFAADTWHQTIEDAYAAAKEAFDIDRGEWGPAMEINALQSAIDPPSHSAIKRLIEILASARTRKHMYFSSVTPDAVENWLNGLHTGCSLAGLHWSPEARRPALEKRGLELLACWETAQLVARGLSSQQIVDELLAIEMEMWQQIEIEGPRNMGDGAPPPGS